MQTSKRPRGNPNWQTASQGRPVRRRWDPDAPQDPPRRASARADSWSSIAMGYGVEGRDKTRTLFQCADVIPFVTAQELWRGDDLGKTIVETRPDEETRAGWEVCVPEDADGNDENYGADLVKKAMHKHDELGVLAAIHTARCYEQAYGGGVVLLGVNDGQSLEQPLDLDRVVSFDYVRAIEPRYVFPYRWQGDWNTGDFNQVELWQITPTLNGAPIENVNLAPVVLVHKSRLLVFEGAKISDTPLRGSLGWWGDGVFTRVYRVLQKFNLSWESATQLVADFAQAIMKIKGLAKIVEKNNKELFSARMMGVNFSKSSLGAVLIDAEEDYERKQTPVTGLPDLLDRFVARVAMAGRIPIIKLAGLAMGGGLSAPGASDVQLDMWRDDIRAGQTHELAPKIRRVYQAIFSDLGGEPDEWTLEFCPLEEMSELEQAQVEKLHSETDASRMEWGVYSAKEVRKSRYGGAKYGRQIRVMTDDGPSAEDEAQYKAEIDPTTGKPIEQPAEATIDPATGKPAKGAAPAHPEPAKQAMNGAQVTSLVEVVQAVAQKQIPPESAQAILELAFQLSSEEAKRIVPKESFEPKEEPKPPSPFGGGPPHGAPPFGGKPGASGEEPAGKPVPPKPDNGSDKTPPEKPAPPAKKE